MRLLPVPAFFFFFNDTATTEIYTLSLPDALPILPLRPIRTVGVVSSVLPPFATSPVTGSTSSVTWLMIGAPGASVSMISMPEGLVTAPPRLASFPRSAQHTSELQSQDHLVCPALLLQQHT